MILTTTDTLPRPYDVLGTVQVVKTVTLRSEAAAERSMDEVLGKLAAKARGADAVIGVRVSTIGLNTLLAVGTAVLYK